MTPKELYDRLEGDYNDMLGRLGMDALIARFVVKFVDDQSVPQLFAAWEAGDEKAAFNAAHQSKGVAANLSLTKVQNLASQICEALREGNEELRASTDVDALVDELRDVYGFTIDTLKDFAAQ